MNMSLRQERMRLLALAPETSLDEALSGISLPGYRIVRGPETGLVMARGRVGNVGASFSLFRQTERISVFAFGLTIAARCANIEKHSIK